MTQAAKGPSSSNGPLAAFGGPGSRTWATLLSRRSTVQDHALRSPRRIIDDQRYAHFVTFSVERRRRLFELDHPKQILLGVLNEELRTFTARCIGFVVMPDHVHAIVWFPQPGQLSGFMHAWKRKSSFHIRNWYRDEAPSYVKDFGEGERFWQPSCYSFEIFDRPKLEEKLAYMHLNPVRAGLTQTATDWKWSSARWYSDQRSVGAPIQWVD